jgi:hypothetical protein
LISINGPASEEHTIRIGAIGLKPTEEAEAMHGIKKPRKPKPEAAAAGPPAKLKASSPQKLRATPPRSAAFGRPVIGPVRPDDQGHEDLKQEPHGVS